jgi:glyoxylase-like metal-dependent hydrolase (beta-lactamase superfamily II)
MTAAKTKLIDKDRVNRICVKSFVPVLFSLLLFCSTSGDFDFKYQVTGPINTNCYLIYDKVSKEAAIIDVMDSVDSLVNHIEENDLKLKYIFATHCHMDHIGGIPDLMKIYPEAKIGYNELEYRDLFRFQEWFKQNWDSKAYQAMMDHPEMGKWFRMDTAKFTKPDIFLEDNQIYKLGDLKIKTFFSPGHSSGSICFYVENVLFSGDVLFYRQVGRTDLLGGSVEDIVRSVRRLYRELPDETRVYPGHGRFTDIGTEKVKNEEVILED